MLAWARQSQTREDTGHGQIPNRRGEHYPGRPCGHKRFASNRHGSISATHKHVGSSGNYRRANQGTTYGGLASRRGQGKSGGIMELLIILVIVALIYGAFHGAHSHRKWNHYRHYPWYRRIWVTIPGPFGTRIGRRI